MKNEWKMNDRLSIHVSFIIQVKYLYWYSNTAVFYQV